MYDIKSNVVKIQIFEKYLWQNRCIKTLKWQKIIKKNERLRNLLKIRKILIV